MQRFSVQLDNLSSSFNGSRCSD
uniref:Uncharacterized protein n=1 Tax=Anguilla anguilla TaxID=7936 RepID=A0A0E9RIB9_ANGAN